MASRRSIGARIDRDGLRIGGAGETVRPSGRPQDGSGAAFGSKNGSRAIPGAPEPPTARQRLVLDDFPLPALARILSPNGREYWRGRRRAAKAVRQEVYLALVAHPLVPVLPPASILYRWIVPDRRQRDLDNHSTGVVKVIQDYLVERGVLPGGDHATALTSRVEIVYERGRRRMEIEIDSADPIGGLARMREGAG